ncbi:MAG: DnaJ domain-containing protein [Synechococcales bacterium]|nr:DnaJ domain-containing protein [Synechococcales bacterium]
MTDLHSYYKILELEPGSSPAEIKRAYRTLVKCWHPDCFPGDPQKQREAEEQIKRLNEAYNLLRNQAEPSPSSSGPMPAATSRSTCTHRPTRPEDYYSLGADCASEEDYQAALDAFSMAIRLNPNYAEAYRHRSFVLAKMGFENRSASDLKRANQIELKRRVSEGYTHSPTRSPKVKPSPPSAHQQTPQTPPASVVAEGNWHCVHTLIGHGDALTSLAVAQNGRVLVSGDEQGQVLLWNYVKMGQAFGSLDGHRGAVCAIAAASDGQLVATGGQDATVRIWHLQTGDLVRVFQGHTAPVTAIAFSPNRRMVISASEDRQICLWDLQQGSLFRTLAQHQAPVRAIAVSSDGQTLISGGDDSCIRLWNLRTAICLKSLPVDHYPVTAIALSPNRQDFVIGTHGSTVQVWNGIAGTVTHTFSGHQNPIRSVVFRQDGQFIASGSDDRTVKIWSTKGNCQGLSATLAGHDGSVRALSFNPKGQQLASASADTTIKIWQMRSPSSP